MAEILLFQHAPGQTAGLLAFAEELRDAATVLNQRVLALVNDVT
jgi:hypothetical protein